MLVDGDGHLGYLARCFLTAVGDCFDFWSVLCYKTQGRTLVMMRNRSIWDLAGLSTRPCTCACLLQDGALCAYADKITACRGLWCIAVLSSCRAAGVCITTCECLLWLEHADVSRGLRVSISWVCLFVLCMATYGLRE